VSSPQGDLPGPLFPVDCAGEDGLKAVASALEGNDTLTSLSLASCKIGHGSTETVAKLLSVNKALARLDISNNGLVDRTFVPILKAVYDSNTLRVLLAGRNQGGQETWGAIAELVRFGSSLRELDLSWMTMRKEGGLPIIGALGSNQVRDPGSIRGMLHGCLHTSDCRGRAIKTKRIHLGAWIMPCCLQRCSWNLILIDLILFVAGLLVRDHWWRRPLLILHPFDLDGRD
jgi:hypothetical protein